MIRKLSGTISDITPSSVVINTSGGVGYIVHIPTLKIKNYKNGKHIQLYIYTHVREQEISLFGFSSSEEIRIFTSLINVSGVGPKSALVILSYAPITRLKEAIINQDLLFFKHIPGIGKKTAQKILLELSEKFSVVFSLKQTNQNKQETELLEALMSLGFRSQEAKEAIEKIELKGTIEQKLSACLQYLNKL